MSPTTTEDIVDTDADAAHIESRCRACMSPQRDEIDRQLGSGRELREIAKEFGLSLGGVHRHARAHIAVENQPPPARPAPPRRFSGCAVCSSGEDRLASINRALAAVFVPDVVRIGERFGFAAAAVLAHWRHAHATMDRAPAGPEHVHVQIAPLVEMTIEEAGALLREQPMALVRARDAMLVSYSGARRTADGVGAEVADIEMRMFQARLRGQTPAGTLLLYRAAAHRFAEIAATDPRKLAGAAAQIRQGRVAAYAPPAASFDAAGFLSALARRGVVLHAMDGDRIAVRGMLSGQDRDKIATNRADIVKFLTPTEIF